MVKTGTKLFIYGIALVAGTGIFLALFYGKIHSLTKSVAERIPSVFKEIIAGLCLGIIGTLVPAVMFSGEEQMGELMGNYVAYVPVALIGIAFLKIFLTNICIQFGLKGGHFFPVIFAGVVGSRVVTVIQPEVH